MKSSIPEHDPALATLIGTVSTKASERILAQKGKKFSR